MITYIIDIIIDTCTNQENSNNDIGLNKSPNLSSHRRTPSDIQTGYQINNYLISYFIPDLK